MTPGRGQEDTIQRPKGKRAAAGTQQIASGDGKVSGKPNRTWRCHKAGSSLRSAADFSDIVVDQQLG